MVATKKPVVKKSPKKPQATSKKTPASTVHNKKVRIPTWKHVGSVVAWPFVTPYRALRKRREQASHKSFVRTRHRDKVKTPKIEGYIAFPWYVLRMLWNRKWLYARFVLVFLVLSVIFIGALQADNISSVNETIDSATNGSDVLGPVMRAVVTVGSSFSGALNNNLSDAQYIYVSILFVLGMLTIVWLLRHQLAGKKLTLRDGLYSAAAPIMAEYVLLIIGIIQLIPAALVLLFYVSATTGGLLNGGIETAMFSLAIFLVIVLTLYFMMTTLFAMFIATIPGTHPLRAYRAARKIVAGQRLRLLLRLVWMLVIVLAACFIVLVPIVIIVNSVGGSNSWAIPLAYQLAVIMSTLYGTAYGYLLYRRMIDEPVNEN